MKSFKTLFVGLMLIISRVAAFAAQTSISYLEPQFDANGAVTGYVTKECTSYQLVENGSGDEFRSNSGWVVFKGKCSYKRIFANGNNFILLNGCKVVAGEDEGGKADGMTVEGSCPTIYAQSTNILEMGWMILKGDDDYAGLFCGTIGVTINGGRIDASGAEMGAGIGGNFSSIDCKNVTINGGYVAALGGYHSAGIGGSENGVCSFITIRGGTVTATGGYLGAGIGGGCDIGNGPKGKCGHGHDIMISGGDVTATGGKNGAGIGGGLSATGYNIKISGGKVTATSPKGGAGIGGGFYDIGYDITISGGSVTAKCEANGGAGIGGGNSKPGYGITISGGFVHATGGKYGAGIGGGGASDDIAGQSSGDGHGYDIMICDGTVYAWGGEYGAGIGGGKHANGYGIMISGGHVTARGGNEGAGIGGGHGSGVDNAGIGRDITVSGGKVTAYAGEDAAAIGGGADGRGYNLTFSGGTVSASLSESDLEWAAIGSGKDGVAAANIRVTGGSVYSPNARLFGTIAKNAAGSILHSVTVPVPGVSPGISVCAAGIPNYGLNDLYPYSSLGDKELYFELPMGDYKFAIEDNIYTLHVGLFSDSITHIKNTDPICINGKKFLERTGDGWSFTNNVLTLNGLWDYTLTGSDLYGQVRVDVIPGAAIKLQNLTMLQPCLNVPCIAFESSAYDARLILSGDNTVYSHDNYPAVGIANDSKVTLSGSGALVGGKATSVNSRCVNNYGDFVMSGGTIRDYTTSSAGGAVWNGGAFKMNGGTIMGCQAEHGGALFNNGTASVSGGTITNNMANSYGGFCYCDNGCFTDIYGGVFGGNAAADENGCNFYYTCNTKYKGHLYGGVFDADPTSQAESGDEDSVSGLALQGGATVNNVGENWIVGTAVTELNGALSGGTYTFNPTNAEYVAAGVSLASCRHVTRIDAVTYRIERDNAGLTVNGVDVTDLSGEGWEYNDLTLTLTNAQTFVLSGKPSDDGVCVQVTACATVILDNVTLVYSRDTDGISFTSTATDATLVLIGDNTVYSQNGCSAVNVADDAKVTLSGSGALIGGKALSKDSGCIVNYGTFVMSGGTIRDYATSLFGGAVWNAGAFTMNAGTIAGCYADYGGALSNFGSALIFGGAITNNMAGSCGGFCYCSDGYRTDIYGGFFSGNSADETNECNLYSGYRLQQNGRLFGGVFAADPISKAESSAGDDGSCLVLQDGVAVTPVGAYWIVGKDVAQRDDALTGGTYYFDPSSTEYEAAGVVLADRRIVEVMGTNPETYRVHVDANFQVDGVRLENGTGEDGWIFTQVEDTGYLTLSEARSYELTGYADLMLLVDVLSNATVTLNGARIRAGDAGREIIRVLADDATIVLAGTNTFYATDGHAAIGVAAGAKLTVRGDGELVGGRVDHASGRCVKVASGGAFVMDGGTISNYSVTENGAAIYAEGMVTMNNGKISSCQSTRNCGGALYNNGGTIEMNGGVIENCTAVRGAAFEIRSGVINIYGGTVRGNSGTASILNMDGGSVTLFGAVFTDNYGERPLNNFNGSLTVCGGVYDFQPSANHGRQPMSLGGSGEINIGDLWIVAANVEARNGELVRGEFTFDPTATEYVSSGLAVSDDATLVEFGEHDYRLSTVSFSTDMIGVCSWSWATNVAGVVAQMNERGMKVMQLSLVPWLNPSDGSEYDASFGPAETQVAFESLSNMVANGELKIVSTMVAFTHDDWSSYEEITNTCGFMYTADSDDPKGEDVWAINSNLIEQAAILSEQLGVTNLSVSAGFLLKPIMVGGINENLDGVLGLARLKAAYDLCSRHSVNLLLEAGQYSGVETMSIVSAFETAYGTSRLGISFDAANNLIYGNDNPSDAFTALKSRIVQVHVSDTFAAETNRIDYGGGFAADVRWGTGDVSIKYDFLKFLRDNDFCGDLLVECQTSGDRASDIDAALKSILTANNTDPEDNWVSPTVMPGETEGECCEYALKAQGFEKNVAESLATTSLYASFRGWAENNSLDPDLLTTKAGVILASAYAADHVEDETNVVITIDEFAFETNVTGTMSFMVNVAAESYDSANINLNLLKASLGVIGAAECSETQFSTDNLTYSFGDVYDGKVSVTVTPKEIAVGVAPTNFFIRAIAK